MMPGMIMLWAGSIATIPSGWHLCNGLMGTPDLRSRFIIGAAVDAGPGQKPNDTGGSTFHDHDFTGDGHSHDLVAGNAIIDSTPAGDFNHSTNIIPAAGTTNTEDGRPPYYALAFIMKL